VDFLVVRAVLVKNYQIKLLRKVWYIISNDYHSKLQFAKNKQVIIVIH